MGSGSGEVCALVEVWYVLWCGVMGSGSGEVCALVEVWYVPWCGVLLCDVCPGGVLSYLHVCT